MLARPTEYKKHGAGRLVDHDFAADISPSQSSRLPGHPPPRPLPPSFLPATTPQSVIPHLCGARKTQHTRMRTRAACESSWGHPPAQRLRLGENRVRRLLKDAALAALLCGLALEEDVSLGTPLRAPGVLDLQSGENVWERRRGEGCLRSCFGVQAQARDEKKTEREASVPAALSSRRHEHAALQTSEMCFILMSCPTNRVFRLFAQKCCEVVSYIQSDILPYPSGHIKNLQRVKLFTWQLHLVGPPPSILQYQYNTRTSHGRTFQYLIPSSDTPYPTSRTPWSRLVPHAAVSTPPE